MADNFGFTEGSGKTIRSDDVSGIQYQVVKLDLGGDGVSIAATANDSTLAGLPVTPRYKRSRLSVTPTISAAAIYASGDAVGGIMTFSNAARATGGSGVIRGVTVIDKDSELAALELVLFDQTIAGTVTDNSAFDPTDADLANVIGWVKIVATTGYLAFADNSAAFVQAEIPYVCNGTSLFGALVTRGTPTYTATTDLTVILTVELD